MITDKFNPFAVIFADKDYGRTTPVVPVTRAEYDALMRRVEALEIAKINLTQMPVAITYYPPLVDRTPTIDPNEHRWFTAIPITMTAKT